MTEKYILNEIISSVIKEQIEAIRQIEELDSKIPWLKDVVNSLSDRMAKSSVNMAINPLEDDYVEISFTGPPDALLAILNAFSGRYVSSKHEKPSSLWFDSTIHLIIDTAKQYDKERGF